MINSRRDARRWLSDRDARSLTFLGLDSRHLDSVQHVKQSAYYYLSDRPRWEYELHVHLYELTFRRYFRTWHAECWRVDHTVNIWSDPDEKPVVLFDTEEVFLTEREAMDRYYRRLHIMRRTFKLGTSYSDKEITDEDLAP